MTLPKAIRHDQYTIISLAICLLLPAAFFGCHLSKPQKQAIISTAATTAEAAATGAPIPWTEIGIALSTIFGSGVFVDNRRKDVLIKRLKHDLLTQATTLDLLTAHRSNTVPGPQPFHNN